MSSVESTERRSKAFWRVKKPCEISNCFYTGSVEATVFRRVRISGVTRTWIVMCYLFGGAVLVVTRATVVKGKWYPRTTQRAQEKPKNVWLLMCRRTFFASPARFREFRCFLSGTEESAEIPENAGERCKYGYKFFEI